jgi:cytidyltransferase-like protein
MKLVADKNAIPFELERSKSSMKLGVILARFQPIHNGHIALIKKAVSENDSVLIFIGSADKLNERNPIPIHIRKDLVIKSLIKEDLMKSCIVVELDDMTSESDNSIEWGFYLYSKVMSHSHCSNFTIYYSDGFEIITKWFPGFILRNNVSLSLLARNSVEKGVSATSVREMILSGSPNLKDITSLSSHSPKSLKV